MRRIELWEEKWKEFLYEDMSSSKLTTNTLSRLFSYFHLSPEKLSADDYFTFTPKLPRYPYQDDEDNIIEDNFTTRVSVAPTIKDAQDAIADMYLKSDVLHVYAGLGPADAVAKQTGCPHTDDMPYDIHFSLSNWLEDKMEKEEIPVPYNVTLDTWLDKSPAHRRPRRLSPAELPEELGDEFEYCVPDAKETKEQWLLKPTKLLYIGTLDQKKNQVRLSNAALSYIRNNF